MSVFPLHTLMLGMVICLPNLTNGNKPKRLSRIEDRLDMVEARQDHASIANREDIEGLALRLDDMETLLNSSITDTPGCQSNPDVKLSPETVSKEMEIMRNAFAAEKSRLRRNTSELETIMNDARSEMHSIKNISEKEVERLEEKITSIQESMILFMEQAERAAELGSERLESLEKSMNALESKILSRLNASLEDVIKSTSKKRDNLDIKYKQMKKYTSCLEQYNSGEHQSGVYVIFPAPEKPGLKVYCDMDSDGGGWTVFQRRKDGSVDFYRGWDEYAAGFGDLNGEFWLGNEPVSTMTSQCCHELRIDLEDFEGNAKYSRFQILPEKDNFRLVVSGYSGDVGDSLMHVHSGMDFSTKDNDKTGTYNCAEKCKGAWWYKGCSRSNLNGEYLKGKHTQSNYEGVHWYRLKNTHKYSLKKTDMKFRAIN